jgi:FkbM family methyltransferase
METAMNEPPRDPFDLIGRYLPDWQPKVIFDVGANVGQSARTYARLFPLARIHSFEPSPASFGQLVLATSGLPNVTPHRLALGRVDATLDLTQGKDSAMNRLLPADSTPPDGTVRVTVRTGADLLRKETIDHLDFLKIDTEGHDHEVLQGFLPVLDKVDFIQVEAAMNPYNKTHVPFGKLSNLLRKEGFHLFHIFDQKMEWKRGGRPVLRRCNPVFISGRLVDLQGIR